MHRKCEGTTKSQTMRKGRKGKATARERRLESERKEGRDLGRARRRRCKGKCFRKGWAVKSEQEWDEREGRLVKVTASGGKSMGVVYTGARK